MYNTPGTVNFYPGSGPRDTAFVLGDRVGLKQLAETLMQAAESPVGVETRHLYASDGHVYELFVTCNLSIEEWQSLPGPYVTVAAPLKIQSIHDYIEIRQEITARKHNENYNFKCSEKK